MLFANSKGSSFGHSVSTNESKRVNLLDAVQRVVGQKEMQRIREAWTQL
jgi:hypothetical protein